jgi:hypothetical protein
VNRVRDLPGVEYIAGHDDEGEAHIHTYIQENDRELIGALIRSEYESRHMYPDVDLEFHVTFLVGRPIDVFVKPAPRLFYSRS